MSISKGTKWSKWRAIRWLIVALTVVISGVLGAALLDPLLDSEFTETLSLDTILIIIVTSLFVWLSGTVVLVVVARWLINLVRSHEGDKAHGWLRDASLQMHGSYMVLYPADPTQKDGSFSSGGYGISTLGPLSTEQLRRVRQINRCELPKPPYSPTDAFTGSFIDDPQYLEGRDRSDDLSEYIAMADEMGLDPTELKELFETFFVNEPDYLTSQGAIGISLPLDPLLQEYTPQGGKPPYMVDRVAEDTPESSIPPAIIAMQDSTDNSVATNDASTDSGGSDGGGSSSD